MICIIEKYELEGEVEYTEMVNDFLFNPDKLLSLESFRRHTC